MNGKRDPMVKLSGRALYLTEDLDALGRQLQGEVLKHDPQRKLIDNISTDELTPGWVCFWYDETLGDYCLVGLRGQQVHKDSIKSSKASVLVSGLSKGCGSSRETAPYSEKVAGIELVVAKTIEKIYGQNCRNIGLLTTTDFGVLERIERGESIPLEEFTRGLNDIEKGIVEYGGLFAYNNARLQGAVAPPPVITPARPMTLVEKIIANRAIADAKTGATGITAVQPGDALFARTDVRFSHDYTTAMCESLFVQGYGKHAKIRNVHSVFAFRDHLTFRNKIMTEAERGKGLHLLVDNLATVQTAFCEKQGIRLFGEVTNEAGEVGSEAICHNAVMEELGGPGQIIVGTDSHTCTAGALGAFAFGVGSTDMANAWFTDDIQVKVPASVRYVLTGKPRSGVTAKDIMLFVMAQEYSKKGGCIGKVLEFSGPGLLHMGMDERATLTNLAVECGATTGIIEADDVTRDYLMQFRGWSLARASEGYWKADAGAVYDATFDIDLASVPQMVATPGDPRNGIEVDQLGEVPFEIAYGGSCTGGKMADMDMYAAVLKEGLARGMHVQAGVKMYIQFGSQRIKRYAVDKGYLAIFKDAGAEVIEPSCGACINAGPGVSRSREQVTVSAINRNFPGRSGPGQVYLASPRVVAASALKGTITTPEHLFR